MSGDWRDMTEEQRRDLLGRAVRVIWVADNEIGLCVRDCCVEEQVRVGVFLAEDVRFQHRVEAKDKHRQPAPGGGS